MGGETAGKLYLTCCFEMLFASVKENTPHLSILAVTWLLSTDMKKEAISW